MSSPRGSETKKASDGGSKGDSKQPLVSEAEGAALVSSKTSRPYEKDSLSKANPEIDQQLTLLANLISAAHGRKVEFDKNDREQLLSETRKTKVYELPLRGKKLVATYKSSDDFVKEEMEVRKKSYLDTDSLTAKFIKETGSLILTIEKPSELFLQIKAFLKVPASREFREKNKDYVELVNGAFKYFWGDHKRPMP